MSTRNVSQLRELLSERFPGTELRSSERARIPSGTPDLDEALGGGLPKGGLTEWLGPGASAAGRIFCGKVARDGGRAVWVDAGRDLTSAGLPDGIVIIRPSSVIEGLEIGERLIRSGGFQFAVVTGADLSSSISVRLVRASREGGCTTLIGGGVPTGALMRVASKVIEVLDPFSVRLSVSASGSGAHTQKVINIPTLEHEVPVPMASELDDRRGDS